MIVKGEKTVCCYRSRVLPTEKIRILYECTYTYTQCSYSRYIRGTYMRSRGQRLNECMI